MAIEFIPIDRDTPYIFPPCVQDYLPAEHLARLVVEIVEPLDLGELSVVYSGNSCSVVWIQSKVNGRWSALDGI